MRRRSVGLWRRLPASLALAALAVVAACSSQGDAAAEQRAREPLPIPPGLLEDERNTIEVFRRASRSVVFITTKDLRRDLFTLNTLEVQAGTGSGFVWDAEGHIVTNAHVVIAGRNPSWVVTLADGTEYDARLIGYELEKDLAVLKIDAPRDQLVPVELGDSHSLVVGQKVLAIGNPFGYDQTLTTGVISALGRVIASQAQTTIRDVIQTDASINPGNSGGPLLDSGGRLIGVNTSIVSPSRASAGIGFAVPVATVNNVVPQLIRYGDVPRVGLGVDIVPDHVARQFGVTGVIIQSVRRGSAAERAGLRSAERVSRRGWRFDVIVRIDEQRITRFDDLYHALENRKAGDSIEVRFLRDGREYETTVVLQDLDLN